MKNKQIIPIGCDHAGYEVKEVLKNYLQLQGYEVKDFGAYSTERVDYPDFGHAVAQFIIDHGGLGILICGSGNGISMSANKHEGIRCAVCWNDEIASLARAHNDANIISIPARFVSLETATSMLKTFLSTSFEGGRHADRVIKIDL